MKLRPSGKKSAYPRRGARPLAAYKIVFKGYGLAAGTG